MSVLFLSTYPVSEPIHGGQKRVAAIYEHLKRNGVSVSIFSFFQKGQYPISKQLGHKFFELDLSGMDGDLADLYLSDVVIADKPLLECIVSDVLKLNIRYVHLEQPYLLPLYREVKKRVPSLKLIYSSQNIEYSMKKDIYERIGFSSSRVQSLVDLVKELEIEAAKEAYFCLAVTESDASFLRLNSGSDVFVLSNGIDYYSPSLSLNGSGSYDFLFVGSAHLPNALGFERMIGYDLSFLPPNARVKIVGGVCHLIQDSIEFLKVKHLSSGRISFHSRLSETALMKEIESAACIILPIIGGGGSNLKTAEALLSLKPIIGTPFAFRGYEGFSNFPHIILVDNKQSFQQKMKEFAKSRQYWNVSKEFQSVVKRVSWGSILENYPISLIN